MGRGDRTHDEALGRDRTALRRTRLPERWRNELGRVDENTVLVMAGLARLSRTIDEVYRADLYSFGLTYSEYTALHTLRIEGPPHRMSPSRINEALALSSGGVSKTIDRLESATPPLKHFVLPGGAEPCRRAAGVSLPVRAARVLLCRY